MEGGGGGADLRLGQEVFFPHHIYCAQSKVKWGGGAVGVHDVNRGGAWPPGPPQLRHCHLPIDQSTLDVCSLQKLTSRYRETQQVPSGRQGTATYDVCSVLSGSWDRSFMGWTH